MARRGPKGNSPEQQAAKGETRPSRKVTHLFPDVASRPDPVDLSPPDDMTDDAKEIWHEKVARYRQRGQKVDGFQHALRQYCEVEAELNASWGTRNPPKVAMITAHRQWAAEFFDTPAAQRVPANGGAGQAGNKFARYGKASKSRA